MNGYLLQEKFDHNRYLHPLVTPLILLYLIRITPINQTNAMQLERQLC